MAGKREKKKKGGFGIFVLLLLIVWILDVRLIRYRDKVLADEEEAERRLQEQEAAEA